MVRFLLLPFIGFCCFMLLCQVKKHYKVFYHLSLYSFAIYLIHVPIIKTLVNFGLYLPNRRLGIYVLWGSTLILSLVCIYILSKIPLFKSMYLWLKNRGFINSMFDVWKRWNNNGWAKPASQTSGADVTSGKVLVAKASYFVQMCTRHVNWYLTDIYLDF